MVGISLADCLAVALLGAFTYATFRPREFAQRFVPPAKAESLAAIRILACLVMLGYVLASDLPSTSRLPRELIVPMGSLSLLGQIPGFSWFLSNDPALGIFQVATGLLLLLGALGWRARITMPLAAFATLVYIGIFWQYTYFFHQCLIGIYVMLVLSVVPCADAWSLDSEAGRTNLKSAQVYGWSRYLCWIVVAVPYFLAGLSKIRASGMSWWWPDNLRGKIFRDTLSDGLLNWDIGLLLVDAPNALFGGIGLFTLSLELCFIAVLFSATARQALPLLVVGLHLGILLLQDFIFVDAMLMQLIFFGGKASGDNLDRKTHERLVLRAFVAIATLTIGWLAYAEYYPISSWKMYAGLQRSPEVTYERVWAEHATAGWILAPYQDCFPAPSHNPYVRIVPRAINRESLPAARAFLNACRNELNDGVPASEHILRWRVERRRWNHRRDPAIAPYGELIAERLIE
jgi:hypothetical protein